MNKEEIIEVLAMKDVEILENLFTLSTLFTPEELKKITLKVQNKEVQNLILNYI